MKLNGKLLKVEGGLKTIRGQYYRGELAVVGDELVAYGLGGDLAYSGLFLNNKRHGVGEETHRYGPTFIGEYKDGKRHGRMTYYSDGMGGDN